MPRIRMVKPEFFDDPDMADVSLAARLFFIGLWTQADKEGRLVDDMRRLKARIFPFDDLDVEALAVELHGKDMIRRYSTGGKHGYVWIRNFTKHQRPHPKEPASLIPPCHNGAGERNGEPCKETAKPSESGVLILDPSSGVLSMESQDLTSTTVAAPNGVLEFPCKGLPSFWQLSQSQLLAWMAAYPSIAVLGECRKAQQWIFADPTRRKTAKGMLRFLVGWLNRASDKLQPAQVEPAERPDDRGHLPPCRTLGECTAKALAEGREVKA